MQNLQEVLLGIMGQALLVRRVEGPDDVLERLAAFRNHHICDEALIATGC